MNKEQAIIEIARLTKLMDDQIEWNFGYMNDAAHIHLEKIHKLAEEFDIPTKLNDRP